MIEDDAKFLNWVAEIWSDGTKVQIRLPEIANELNNNKLELSLNLSDIESMIFCSDNPLH